MADFTLIPKDDDNPVPQPHMIKKGNPKSFSCPNCAGTVKVEALGLSITAICQFCSSVIDIANENYKILKTAHEKTRPTLLNIGSKGRLQGLMWEVIGYMEKTDFSEIYRWDEYLLYNPYHGFRFLVQSQGHWSIYKLLKQSIQEQGIALQIRVNNQKYTRFMNGKTLVAYVKGEFYWRVRKGEETVVTDYIAPPYQLSITKNDDEITAALGEYLDAKAVAKAFKVEGKMPYKTGVAPNQPGSYTGAEVGKLWLTTLSAFAIATLIQFAYLFSADNKYIYSNHWNIPVQNRNQTIATEPFELPKRSNMLITGSSADLRNDWVELDITVLNDNNEEVRQFKQPIEYYFGSDYDGTWSEGNNFSDTLLSSLPKGNYRLLIDTDAGAFQKNQPLQLAVKIKRDVINWSNYGFTLLLLLIYPCYAGIRFLMFEKLRWSESDYTDKFWS